MKTLNLATRDLQHIWHPCSQMKDYETFAPLEVIGAEGSYIQLADGRRLIDAISSWWCKSLGHQHPRLKKALAKQMERFEHVIFANTTNEVIVTLSEKLTALTNTLNKVFYAGDGSCAVEIAMKMSLHARRMNGESKRTRFIALENSYHGETIGALSVSDVGLYRDPYASLLLDVDFISPLPYVSSMEDALWHSCEDHWKVIEEKLMPLADKATAIIIEPIVQGAGGMKIYSQDFLRRLSAWAKAHHIHLIADEIMTGLGRTGKMLAIQHAGIEPDFLCLSKGLTSGWLPFSAVLTTTAIYEIFYDDYSKGKSFLHSHTYSGNVLAASVALEVLTIFAEEQICAEVTKMSGTLYSLMQAVAHETQQLTNVRGIGALVAADLTEESSTRRLGYEVYQQAIQLGALLRPLGRTIYWLPPLNIEKEVLIELKDITVEAISRVMMTGSNIRS